MMSLDKVMYVCDHAKKCGDTECEHYNPHDHTVGCDVPCVAGSGLPCVKIGMTINVNSSNAQELLNVISMAAGEGCEFEFTEELAKKLGEFIDGGV